jgi:F0F1-type ATP synthase membrane subunit a
MQMLLASPDPLEEVLPHTYFHIGPFGLTNQMVMALFVALLMILIFPRLFAKPETNAPTGAKNLFESILEFLRIEVFRPALKEYTDKFAPFLWSLFFFILFCNILGCIPFPAIFEAMTAGHLTHFGGPPTGGISTTIALAACAFFFIHVHGIDNVARALMNGTYWHHDHGGHGSPADGDPTAEIPSDPSALGDPTGHYEDGHPSHFEATGHEEHDEPMSPVLAIILAIPLYLWNFAPHPFKPKAGESKVMWLADIPMFSLLLVLELLGAVIKPFALCMRLFGNMVAGHILLAVLISLIVMVPRLGMQVAVGIPIGLLDLGIQLLELLVALLQAYIFTVLTTLFLASAVAPEH